MLDRRTPADGIDDAGDRLERNRERQAPSDHLDVAEHLARTEMGEEPHIERYRDSDEECLDAAHRLGRIRRRNRPALLDALSQQWSFSATGGRRCSQSVAAAATAATSATRHPAGGTAIASNGAQRRGTAVAVAA